MNNNSTLHRDFNEITHKPLRVYNRVVLMNNLLETVGKEEASEYLQSFTDLERKDMTIMAMYIRAKGVPDTQKMVTRGLEFAE